MSRGHGVAASPQPTAAQVAGWKCSKCFSFGHQKGAAVNDDNWCSSCGACDTMQALVYASAAPAQAAPSREQFLAEAAATLDGINRRAEERRQRLGLDLPVAELVEALKHAKLGLSAQESLNHYGRKALRVVEAALSRAPGTTVTPDQLQAIKQFMEFGQEQQAAYFCPGGWAYEQLKPLVKP